MTDVQGNAGDEDSPEQGAAERARNDTPRRSGPTDAPQGVFEDQRDIDPQGVPAIETLRTVVTLGCATLDESLVGQALPASAVIRPHGVELTICHAGSLELSLPAIASRGPDALSASTTMTSLDELREIVWLMGPARLPRSAIVGRALHDLRAVMQDAAQSNVNVCVRIQQAGSHHLRNEIVRDLELVNTSADSSRPVRSLSNLLKSAIDYLTVPGWLALRALPDGGSYLQGEGLRIFNGFPAWDRIDAPPQPPGRPTTTRTHAATDQAGQPGDSPPGHSPP